MLPLRRRRGWAALGSVVVLSWLALVPGVRAAEPDIDALLDAAAAAGLACTGAPESWLCHAPDLGPPGTVTIDTGEAFAGFSATLSRQGSSGGAPDLHDLMDRYVVLILGDDPDALAWLDRAQVEGLEYAEFTREGWRMDWSTVDPSTGKTRLTIGRDVPTVGVSPDPEPSASFGPPSSAPVELAESSLGTWTYSGTWTLVAVTDDGGFDPDPPIGTTRPAQLEIACESADRSCLVNLRSGQEGLLFFEADVLEPGRLRGVKTSTPDACPEPETQTEQLDVEHGPATAVATQTEVTVPDRCVVGETTVIHYDSTYRFSGTFTGFVPAVEPSPAAGTAAPSAEAVIPPASSGEDPGAAGGTSGSSGRGPAGVQPFASSIPTVADVSTDPTVLLQSALLAGLLVFLMPFPSQLFNSTLEAHEDRVRRRLRLDRIGQRIGGLGSFWTSWPGAIVAVLGGALLYGFLDPTFGFGPASLATFLGILLGIVIVTVAFAVPLLAIHRREGDRAWVKVVPISLLVAVGCVLISRLTAFQPGYLYGLLIGVGFARELSAADEGRATALGAALMLGAAALAWLVLGALPEGADLGLVVVRTALAALMVAGLEGVVFGLLPIRALPGEALFGWRRPLWAFLLLVGAFAFFHILINPASGYLSDTSRTPLITVLVLLVGFSLGSLAFWAWFRLRPDAPAGRA